MTFYLFYLSGDLIPAGVDAGSPYIVRNDAIRPSGAETDGLIPLEGTRGIGAQRTCSDTIRDCVEVVNRNVIKGL